MAKITDEEILGWLNSGDLVVGLDNPETITFFGRVNTVSLIGDDNANEKYTRYRFKIRHNRRRRTIVRSKLVYMAAERIIIPSGFEIHHLDEDRYNDVDWNLVMVTGSDHKKIHGVTWECEEGEVPF